MRTPAAQGRGFLVASLASLTFALLAGCGESTGTPEPTNKDTATPPSGWRAVVGAGGTFAQTFDDVRWETKRLGSATLFSVACVGNLDGWAAGEGGAIGRTVDGGLTWTWQSSGLSQTLRSVRFGNVDDGVVVGDGGALAVTHDGGDHWSTTRSVTTRDLHGVAIAASAGLSLAVGDGGTLLRSVDRGQTWSVGAPMGTSIDLRGVAIDPQAHLALAVDAGGGLWASTDQGTSFHREGDAGLRLEGVALADGALVAVAVGAGGTILIRGPAGVWRKVASATTVDLHAALVSDTKLYVGGDGGTLLVSDAGDGWSRVPIDSTSALYGLEDL